MSRLRTFLLAAALSLAGPAQAQDLGALARIDPAASSLEDTRDGVFLTLALSQPVPYRVFTLDEPPRLVLDFSEVDWAGLDAASFDASEQVTEVAFGTFRPAWSRMVVKLAAPLAVASAGMDTTGGARVEVRLEEVSVEDFAARAGAPASATFDLPDPVADLIPPARRQDGSRPVVVMLDPGHGGLDPGAERDGVVEAHLMLQFARELREILRRAGGFEVMLTRDDDIFVPLEMRQSIARAAGADVFISLHADAIPEGRATGATIYTLADAASDIASEKLAERHDRADLLAGVDLTDHDDAVATVLMELARTETAPRSDKLADELVEALTRSLGTMHKRPRLEASFSVLKAADIPSVLVELGFMSSEEDLENLRDADWRRRAAEGIRDALVAWAAADAAEAELLRQ